MPWTDLTFPAGSVLTSAKMTQLDANFDALAAQEVGAPLVSFPNSDMVANAGARGSSVASFQTFNAESGFNGPQVSSFGRIEVASEALARNLRVTLAGSFGGVVHSQSGFIGLVASLGAAEVSSNITVFGGLRLPHFALRFDAGNPPTVQRQTNVSCLERKNTGQYEVHLATAFTNSHYYLDGIDVWAGATFHKLNFRQESSNLSRLMLVISNQAGTVVDSGLGFTIKGMGN